MGNFFSDGSQQYILQAEMDDPLIQKSLASVLNIRTWK